MKLELHTNNRGYVINVDGVIKDNGEFSYINTEEIKLIEFIGEVILGKKVSVTVK